MTANNVYSYKKGDLVIVNGMTYKILSGPVTPLGRFGEVYKAKRKSLLGRDVALKIMISEPNLYDPSVIQSYKNRLAGFKREQDALRKILPCNIAVKILDYSSTEKSSTIVEEWLDPKQRICDMSSRRDVNYTKVMIAAGDSRFTLEQAYSFLIQLFVLLDYANLNDIAYWDFNPSHFFWTWNHQQGILKVVDWNVIGFGVEGISDQFRKFRGEQDLGYGLTNAFPEPLRSLITNRKINSAREMVGKLLEFGVEQDFRCPSVIPWHYRLSDLKIRIKKRFSGDKNNTKKK